MSEGKRPKVTAGLRAIVTRYSRYRGLTSPEGTPCVKCEEAAFEDACDAIDAIHAALEEENDRLRDGERRTVSRVKVEARVDWERMARDMEEAARAIRAMGGGAA